MIASIEPNSCLGGKAERPTALRRGTAGGVLRNLCVVLQAACLLLMSCAPVPTATVVPKIVFAGTPIVPAQPSAPPAPTPSAESTAWPTRAIEPGVLKLQTLLRDPVFALAMAQHMQAAESISKTGTIAAFPTTGEEGTTLTRLVRDQKIAQNLAGFYALEVGMAAIMDRTRATPLEILDAVNTGSLTSEDTLLLARFAHATWKAGQPFRGIDRIERQTYKTAALLAEEDISNDIAQIKGAALLLGARMKDAQGRDTRAQLERLQSLLRDPVFALEMAQALDAAYYKSAGQSTPLFLRPDEATATFTVGAKDEMVAQNLAAFYALEVGATALAERNKITPMMVIESARNGLLAPQDLLLLARFANATWKAGQPFRGLDQIQQSTFKPAAMLNDDDVIKDMARIKAAASRVMDALK